MKHIFLCISTLFFLFYPQLAFSGTLMPDPSSGKIEIICGMDDDGNEVKCNLNTHTCFKCLETDRIWLTLGIVSDNKEVFKCVAGNSAGNNCKVTNNGGISGDSYIKVFTLHSKHKQGKQCITSNFFIKYSNCYGCEIVRTLISSFIKAGSKAYEISRQAANAVALLCMMFWLAFFVFKNVTSFTSVEPMKLLQEFFMQCFKVVLALVIINSGISTILHYSLVPILEAGIDMANAISAAGNNITSEYKNGGTNG